jgi:hypothetical protein
MCYYRVSAKSSVFANIDTRVYKHMRPNPTVITNANIAAFDLRLKGMIVVRYATASVDHHKMTYSAFSPDPHSVSFLSLY